ncbi:MAG: ERAP1-like C-terminal domain-containing protein, partial [Propionibacteriaceae bacterium]|nr:ERAP1-like C-terminal domain-containing protein [Propionibacteriaceae bacterium]
NTLHPELELDSRDRIESCAIRQSAADAPPTRRDHRIAGGIFQIDGERLQRRMRVETDITGERTMIPELAGQPRPDLVLLNEGDLTFAKIRLDEDSRTTMVEHIDRIDDELTRSLLWGAAWDLCRDGELPVVDYVSMVLRGIAAETDQTAVSRALGQAQTATTLFLAPRHRGPYQAKLIAGLAGLLRDAEPGSDHQLAFARALASAIHTPAGAALLQGWLDDQEVPQGLQIDQDLRWHMIIQLARVGAIDDGGISSELERDNTLTGAEQAAGARAAQPTAAAKARAWHRATADPTIPNETHRQICLQFAHPGQEEQLQLFASPYFELAERISAKAGVWAHHGVHLAQSALRYLFPTVVVDQEYIRILDEWLVEAPLQDSVRRIIAEARDDAQRSLRVRQRNRGLRR